MSGIPGIGLTNPIANGLLSCAIAVENFARRWNRQPPVPPNFPVRHPTRHPFPRINDRDAAMGFAPAKGDKQVASG